MIKLGDMIEKMGFYTTQYVEAENQGIAERKAVELIQNDEKLNQVVLNDPDNPPVLSAEKVLKLDSFEGVNHHGAGYSFYRYADDTD